jgi:hypothetical protein
MFSLSLLSQRFFGVLDEAESVRQFRKLVFGYLDVEWTLVRLHQQLYRAISNLDGEPDQFQSRNRVSHSEHLAPESLQSS